MGDSRYGRLDVASYCVDKIGICVNCFCPFFFQCFGKYHNDKKESTAAILLSYLTSTFIGINVSILLIINLTTLSLYILIVTNYRLGGHLYSLMIQSISQLSEVSNTLTRSARRIQIGKLWRCLRCKSCLMVTIFSTNK